MIPPLLPCHPKAPFGNRLLWLRGAEKLMSGVWERAGALLLYTALHSTAQCQMTKLEIGAFSRSRAMHSYMNISFFHWYPCDMNYLLPIPHMKANSLPHNLSFAQPSIYHLLSSGLLRNLAISSPPLYLLTISSRSLLLSSPFSSLVLSLSASFLLTLSSALLRHHRLGVRNAAQRKLLT